MGLNFEACDEKIYFDVEDYSSVLKANLGARCFLAAFIRNLISNYI